MTWMERRHHPRKPPGVLLRSCTFRRSQTLGRPIPNSVAFFHSSVFYTLLVFYDLICIYIFMQKWMLVGRSSWKWGRQLPWPPLSLHACRNPWRGLGKKGNRRLSRVFLPRSLLWWPTSRTHRGRFRGRPRVYCRCFILVRVSSLWPKLQMLTPYSSLGEEQRLCHGQGPNLRQGGWPRYVFGAWDWWPCWYRSS